MQSKPLNRSVNPSARRRGVGLIAVMALLTGTLNVQGQGQAQENPVDVEQAGATADSRQPDSDNQAPDPETIEDVARGQASLDYEPSESISEDRSVSFPVDI